MVSRKKEFIPAIEKVIKNKQFAEHVKKISLEISKRDSKINYGKLVFDTNKGCSGQLVRKESVHLRELIFQHLRSPSVKLPEKCKLFLGNSTRSASHNSEAGQ